MSALPTDTAAIPKLRFGLVKKFLAGFGVIAILLVGFSALVMLEVGSLRLQTHRISEESEESEALRSMTVELEGILRHDDKLGYRDRENATTGTVASNSNHRDQFDHLRHATEALAKLRSSPVHEDPAESGHRLAERTMYAHLSEVLGQVRTLLESSSDVEARTAKCEHAISVVDNLADLSRRATAVARESSARHRDRLLLGVATVAGIAVLSLTVMMILVMRGVIRPIRRLQEGASRIGGGDFAHRVPADASDEIGVLANQVNKMASALGVRDADMREQIETKTRELVRAGRLAGLGTLAAGFAHEINTPLASIATCAEGLLDSQSRGSLDERELEEYLRIIMKESFRAHDIANRLLEFSRVEAAPEAAVDIASCLREVELLLRHSIAKQGVDIVVDVPHGVQSCSMSESECKEILINLITNAADACPHGGTVHVEARETGESIQLKVTDNGVGIPAEHIDRIFDPFFTTKDTGDGTGLGLYVIHAIVQRHGGEISAESSGNGTTFSIRMPKAMAVAPAS